MRVLEIWRYPAKSLLGEQLSTAQVTSTGLDGDRAFAIFDVDTGLGLTARRMPELLHASARALPGGGVEITAADGSVIDGDAALSAWLGRPVALRSTADVTWRRYENPSDFEHEDTVAWNPFRGAAGAFHDDDDATVSLVSTASVRGWDRRRFRANVVVDGAGEDELVGARVAVGDALLDIGTRISRCVMVTRPQAAGPYGAQLERDLDVLRTIHRERGGALAVGATVGRGGVIRVGDEVRPSA